MAIQRSMVSSKSNEWATPIDFFRGLDAEFGFTLDPCSTHENCKVAKHYTKEEDGLTQDWSNEVVFMNPPYGGNTCAWLKKALAESKRGATVVCLIVAATDRHYWHDVIFPYAAQIRFVRGRLKFNDVNSSAPFASAVVVFTDKIKYSDKICFYSKVNQEPKDIDNALDTFKISGNCNEWETPSCLFSELDSEFSFTLDACAASENHKCAKYYTIEDNGLVQDWSNEVVFVHPPGGGTTGDWIKKAYLESLRGATVVCLLVSSPDRSYWHDYIFPYAAQIRFVRGRIRFGGLQATAPFANAVVIFTEKYKFADRVVNYAHSVSEARARGERQVASVSAKHPKGFLAINY